MAAKAGSIRLLLAYRYELARELVNGILPETGWSAKGAAATEGDATTSATHGGSNTVSGQMHPVANSPSQYLP